MPTAFETSMSDLSFDLIERFGTELTLTRPGDASKAAQKPKGVLTSYDDFLIGTGAVKATDVQVVIASKGLSWEPQDRDLIRLPDGQDGVVLAVKRAWVQGTKVVHKLRVAA